MPMFLVEMPIRAVIDASSPEQAKQRLARNVERGVECLRADVNEIKDDGDVPIDWRDAVPLDGDSARNISTTVHQRLHPMLPREVPRVGKTAYQGEDDCG